MRWTFWASLSLSMIGCVSLAYMWGFDSRTCLVPMYFSSNCLGLLFDAMPPNIRMFVGPPMGLLFAFILAVVIILINFRRFPDFDTSSIEIGTFGGLAITPL